MLKNILKYGIQIVAGSIIACIIAYFRLPQMEEGAAGTMMAFSDGFAVVGLLYFCFGGLLFASTTGFMDPLEYFFKKCSSVILPRFGEYPGNYYDFKLEKSEKRKTFKEKSVLIVGAFLVLISVVFTIIWYQIA